MNKQRKEKHRSVERGEVYYVELGEGIGSEQSGSRPCVIIQNDKGNKNSPTTIVALITKVHKNSHLPVHVPISTQESGLPMDSVILAEQIRTISKQRLGRRVSKLNYNVMEKVNNALAVSLISTTGNKVERIRLVTKDFILDEKEKEAI